MLAKIVGIILCCTTLSLFGKSITISQHTDRVQRRFYLVNRLATPIELLLHDEKVGKALHFEQVPLHLFTLLKPTVEEMCNKKNLKPLERVWESFATYKQIEQDKLGEELVTLVYCLYQLLEQNSKATDTDPQSMLETIDGNLCRRYESLPITQLLSTIKKITSALHITTEPHPLPCSSRELSDIAPQITPDDIATRFYYIQRLEKTMHLLYTIMQKKHASIQTRDLVNNTPLTTVLTKWIDFRSYKLIENPAFPKTLCIATYETLDHLYRMNNPYPDFPFDIPSNNNFYNQSPDTFNLEELLQAIDILTEQILILLNQQESSYLARFRTFIHRWGLPIAVLSSIILKISSHFFASAQEASA